MLIWCCQTNSNQSQLGQGNCPLLRENATPLSKSGSAVQLEVRSAGEAAVSVEMM